MELVSLQCSCRIFLDRKVSNLQPGTVRSCRELYQESKEPGKPQESGYSPNKKVWIKCEECAEDCSDGGANCLLTTTLVSYTVQHHVGNRGHPCSTLWWLFDHVVYNGNLTRSQNTTSIKCCFPSSDAIYRQEKNSGMCMKVQGHLMRVYLIEIHKVFANKKVRFFSNRPCICAEIDGCELQRKQK